MFHTTQTSVFLFSLVHTTTLPQSLCVLSRHLVSKVSTGNFLFDREDSNVGEIIGFIQNVQGCRPTQKKKIVSKIVFLGGRIGLTQLTDQPAHTHQKLPPKSDPHWDSSHAHSSMINQHIPTRNWLQRATPTGTLVALDEALLDRWDWLINLGCHSKESWPKDNLD
jgi:hypothetical protein